MSATKHTSNQSPTIKTIAFQGAKGAYSDIACRDVCPHAQTVPCTTFEDAFTAVVDGSVDAAMIPIENTLAGRVADVHHFLPKSGLHIIAEHYLPIRHCLLGTQDATLETITSVHSHIHALPQCRKIIKELGLKPFVHDDTAGAAEKVARDGDKTQCAIASPLAAEIYGLKILRADVQDRMDNVTRFVLLTRTGATPPVGVPSITALHFRVRNIPAALYKALGGFATNGVNMTKLESYIDASLQAAGFYLEVEGHVDDPALQRALDELKFFCADMRVIGTFPAHGFRSEA